MIKIGKLIISLLVVFVISGCGGGGSSDGGGGKISIPFEILGKWEKINFDNGTGTSTSTFREYLEITSDGFVKKYSFVYFSLIDSKSCDLRMGSTKDGVNYIVGKQRVTSDNSSDPDVRNELSLQIQKVSDGLNVLSMPQGREESLGVYSQVNSIPFICSELSFSAGAPPTTPPTTTPPQGVIEDPLLSTVAKIGSFIEGLTFDDHNNLYISTVSGKIVKLDGVSLSTFIPEGVAGLDFNGHIRFSQGNFYIENTLNVLTDLEQVDEVLLFDNAGVFTRRLLDETTVGALLIEEIAVNAQGQLYVAALASTNALVLRIDANGLNLTNIVQSGDGGAFIVTSMAVDSTGNLYVGTPSVVSKFDANGTFLNKVAEEGITPGFNFSSNLAVDRNDNLYIGNTTLGDSLTPSRWNVLRFDSSGLFQGEFIPAGAGGVGAFPEDMAFDIQGRLYVADSEIVRFDQAGNLDRTGTTTFKGGLSSKPSGSKRTEEKERHYRELEIKEKALSEEFSREF